MASSRRCVQRSMSTACAVILMIPPPPPTVPPGSLGLCARRVLPCSCLFARTNNQHFNEIREAIEKMENEERERVAERQARVDSVMAVSEE